MPSTLGPAEILVILVIALIVLGPKRLPEAGRQVGKALSEVRRWSQDIKDEMRDAINPDQPQAKDPLATLDPVANAARKKQSDQARSAQMKAWAERAGYIPKPGGPADGVSSDAASPAGAAPAKSRPVLFDSAKYANSGAPSATTPQADEASSAPPGPSAGEQL